MNSISWIVGHLAWQEQRTFFLRRRGELLFHAINEEFAFGAQMSTPSIKAMRKSWNTITKTADPFLDSFDDQGPDARPSARRQAKRPKPRLRDPADDLALLVPHRGDSGDPSNARTPVTAPVRRQPRGDGGLPSRKIGIRPFGANRALPQRELRPFGTNGAEISVGRSTRPGCAAEPPARALP